MAHVQPLGSDFFEQTLLRRTVGDRIDVQREPGRATAADLDAIAREGPVESREHEGGRARGVSRRVDHFHRDVAAQADTLAAVQGAVSCQLAR